MGSTTQRRVPLSRPSLDQTETEAVTAVLRSGWLTTGDHCRLFEQELADYVGAAHAISVSSATAGLHLLLHTLDLQPGDEVIVPSLTWPATVNAVVLAGGKPVFADVDRGTRNVAPQAVAAALGPRTRAILAVHFGGAPCDLDPLRAIAARANAALLEDAAHALGTEYRGQRVGGADSTAVFSFHPTKNITCGEGGMVTTARPDLARRLRLLRFHGVDRDCGFRSQGARRADYDVSEPGFKYNLTDLQAAIGRVQLGKLDGFIARRREIAESYDAALAGLAGLTLATRAPFPHRHAQHLYTLELAPHLERDAFMAELERRGVQTGIHFPAVHTKSFYREHYPIAEGSLPVTEALDRSLVSLPLYPGLDDEDVRHVVDSTAAAIRAASTSPAPLATPRSGDPRG